MSEIQLISAIIHSLLLNKIQNATYLLAQKRPGHLHRRHSHRRLTGATGLCTNKHISEQLKNTYTYHSCEYVTTADSASILQIATAGIWYIYNISAVLM